MTFPGLLIFWPPKIPTSTPPWVGRSIFLGRNHPQICRDLCILNPFSYLFFAFKVTISRHFAGYASIALETIWLHEPRDLIFLGPPMTLLCLSRYSSDVTSLSFSIHVRISTSFAQPRTALPILRRTKLIRKRFWPKCVCLRGSAPDPAEGLTAPPDPQLEKVGLHTNPSHRCQPSRIRRDSPAFSSDVPRSREISRCPAFFENGIIIFFRCRLDPILHVCLATQQSNELRIKIGKDRFRIRTPTGHWL